MDHEKYKQRYEHLARMPSDMSVRHFPRILALRETLSKDKYIEFVAEFLI
jgi:hypothetical protein